MLTRSKVQGMIIGGGIGDALGRPAECMSQRQVSENYPEPISDYVIPHNNKWFKDDKKGVTTDDTQLTIAVLKGLLRANGFGMGTMAKMHVLAYKDTTEGWANTTREAVIRLYNGSRWSESGKSQKSNRGAGNGVVMKVAPLAAWYAIQKNLKWHKFADKLVQFAAMTHYTQVAARSGVVHASILHSLLWNDISRFDRLDFFTAMWKGMDGRSYKRSRKQNQHYCVGNLNRLEQTDDQFVFNLLDLYLWKEMSVEDAIVKYGGGNGYVCHSQPMAYFFFLKNPFSVESLYEVIRAGGDTDTNGKIVGEMLGALHGIELFQTSQFSHLYYGLKNHDELMELANNFCDKFGIK